MTTVYRNPIGNHLMERHQAHEIHIPLADDDVLCTIETNGNDLIVKIVRGASPRLRQVHNASDYRIRKTSQQ